LKKREKKKIRMEKKGQEWKKERRLKKAHALVCNDTAQRGKGKGKRTKEGRTAQQGRVSCLKSLTKRWDTNLLVDCVALPKNEVTAE
jgi:hypothetical protein